MKDTCPQCNIYADPIEAHSSTPVAWRCPKCAMEWDINEDFKCVHCGKDVPGRFLFCSESCEFENDKLIDWPKVMAEVHAAESDHE